MNRMFPCLLVLFAGAAAPASAQLRVDWYTVDGGGGASAAGRFELRGTVGQPDAEEVSLCSLDGGEGCVQPRFQLTGGFWAGGAVTGAPGDAIFRNGFEP